MPNDTSEIGRLTFESAGTLPGKHYPPTEVARICRVSTQIIERCFDKGELKGHHVPESKFRRVPYANLVDFMRKNKLSDIPSPQQNYLVITPYITQEIHDQLEALMADAFDDVKVNVVAYKHLAWEDADALQQSEPPRIIIEEPENGQHPPITESFLKRLPERIRKRIRPKTKTVRFGEAFTEMNNAVLRISNVYPNKANWEKNVQERYKRNQRSM
jgi:hypothetical protein